MAIQNRRGNESDFDPNKMLPGEWATATDTEKVWMCFKTGKVRRMATYEDMVENIGEATEEIKTEFTAGVKSATEAAAGAANTANKAAETASDASNTANAAAETAMNAAEKAEAAAGGDISEKTVSFEEVETYSKPTSGSKISSIIANLVMGISQLFSDLANKIDSSRVLSAEEWGAAISERGYLADAKDVKDAIFGIINTIYPIGSVYMSVNPTDPKTLFGIGTWERIQDKFLLAAGSTYSAGSTGGAATVTLTTDQIPSHRHGDIFVDTSRLGWQLSFAKGTSFNGLSTGGERNWVGTGYTGGGKSHNNMPPYLTVYTWKRIK